MENMYWDEKGSIFNFLNRFLQDANLLQPSMIRLLIYLIIHLSTSKSFICEQFNDAVRTLKKCTTVCMEVTN